MLKLNVNKALDKDVLSINTQGVFLFQLISCEVLLNFSWDLVFLSKIVMIPNTLSLLMLISRQGIIRLVPACQIQDKGKRVLSASLLTITQNTFTFNPLPLYNSYVNRCPQCPYLKLPYHDSFAVSTEGILQQFCEY